MAYTACSIFFFQHYFSNSGCVLCTSAESFLATCSHSRVQTAFLDRWCLQSGNIPKLRHCSAYWNGGARDRSSSLFDILCLTGMVSSVLCTGPRPIEGRKTALGGTGIWKECGRAGEAYPGDARTFCVFLQNYHERTMMEVTGHTTDVNVSCCRVLPPFCPFGEASVACSHITYWRFLSWATTKPDRGEEWLSDRMVWKGRCSCVITF
ncbi:hypothetical protein B0H63DRAFT_132087 [Podospora didyma]|uniref:Uncharacterized protein n=1 Tax=Podospora didyma TaxID=330526 RepID=A0AAE0P0M4_9PEZI|nr:hypothetical protein B0H63DRAFT_132087 [Podospora didyma]